MRRGAGSIPGIRRTAARQSVAAIARRMTHSIGLRVLRGRLVLIVVQVAALLCGTTRRRRRRALRERQKPAGICGVDELGAKGAKPRQSLDDVAVRHGPRARAHTACRLDLCHQHCLTVHWVRIRPHLLCVRPVIIHESPASGCRGVKEAGVITRHNGCREAHVIGWWPIWRGPRGAEGGW